MTFAAKSTSYPARTIWWVIGALLLWFLPAPRTAAATGSEPGAAASNTIHLSFQRTPGTSGQSTGIVDSTLLDPLTVLVERDGHPLTATPVQFELSQTPQGGDNAHLSTVLATTDANGLAQTTITLGAQQGAYLVTAWLPRHPETKPATTTITARARTWLLLLLITVLGGLGIFLLGMDFTSKGLKSTVGQRMKKVMSTLTQNRISALAVGVIITALLQSSSASTVMLVGFVEATTMTLTQAIGVTLGAKIGTTITAQLIAFNLANYALLLVTGGFLFRTVTSNRNVRAGATTVLGFGLIFFGIGVMSQALSPLRSNPTFTGLLLSIGNNPIIGVVAATAFTAVVQSSAATIGLAIALCSGGLITLEAGLPLAFGAHIGTSATALLASLGTGKAGKQVALAHLIVSVLGVAIALPLLPIFIDLANWFTQLIGSASTARALANGHMIFTIITGLILLPFVNPIKRLTCKLLPLGPEAAPFGPRYLNRASLTLPSTALDLAQKEVLRMVTILQSMLERAMEMLCDPQMEAMDQMDKEDDKIDLLEKAIRAFLTKLDLESLSSKSVARAHAFIYIVQDLEGIGDILTKELAHTARKHCKRDINFSESGLEDLRSYHQQVLDKFNLLETLISEMNPASARQLLESDDNERLRERALQERHLARLHEGVRDTVASSRGHLSVLSNLRAISEKINDSARTIAEDL